MPHAQNRAVVNLFRGPNLIEDVAITMRRLEEGDLKLRVRALDSERALTRVLVRSLYMHCRNISQGDRPDEALHMHLTSSFLRCQ